MRSKNKFEISPVADYKMWDDFVERSPQGTIFSTTYYLEAVGRGYERFFILKGDKIKAGLCYVLTNDGSGCELDDLIIYNGIMFLDDPHQKSTKARSERFEINELIIEELDRRFNKVELALAPQFEDLRPFLWHNYHSPNPSDKFIVDLRYTSYINISELGYAENDEDTSLFGKLDTIRQRNIREALKKGAHTAVGQETDLFIEFYASLMNSQNDPSPLKKLDAMSRLVNALINDDKAVMLMTKNPAGKIIYVTVFCMDLKRAYYLFGAGDLEAIERYKGTIAFWDAFRILNKDYGVKQVDFEGVNSPQRGWFKLSFGGNLVPYYQVYLG